MTWESKNAESFRNWERSERGSFYLAFCNFSDKFAFLWPGTNASSCMKTSKLIWTELVFNWIVLSYCNVCRTIRQRISLDCETSFYSSRESTLWFSFESSTNILLHEWFCSIAKGNLVFTNVFFSPRHTTSLTTHYFKWTSCSKAPQTNGWVEACLCSTVTKCRRVRVLQDDDYCRIAECRHFLLVPVTISTILLSSSSVGANL